MKLALLGDIALFGRASIDGNRNWQEYFKDVATVLKGFDYVVGNLESPFSLMRKRYGAKSAYLCSQPENIELLKILHINAVTIANNHMFDYGVEGFELTKHLLDEAGIEWFGADGRDVLIEKDDNKLAFTGFCCYSTNPQGCVPYGEKGINEFDLQAAHDVLLKYHNDGYLNVCAVHAGIEHVNYPSIDTIKAAGRLVETGPMIYYGHHPHVVQPVVRAGDSLIAYSLGNFCFDDTYLKPSDTKQLVELSEGNRSSFILVGTIEHNAIKDYDIIPVYIGKDKIHVGQGCDRQYLDRLKQDMDTKSASEYEKTRMEQRQAWVLPRKKARNLTWLVKRLRPRYFRLLITNRQNAQKYIEHVSKYL